MELPHTTSLRQNIARLKQDLFPVRNVVEHLTSKGVIPQFYRDHILHNAIQQTNCSASEQVERFLEVLLRANRETFNEFITGLRNSDHSKHKPLAEKLCSDLEGNQKHAATAASEGQSSTQMTDSALLEQVADGCMLSGDTNSDLIRNISLFDGPNANQHKARSVVSQLSTTRQAMQLHPFFNQGRASNLQADTSTTPSNDPWKHPDFYLDEYHGWILRLNPAQLRIAALRCGLIQDRITQMQLSTLEAQGPEAHNSRFLYAIMPGERHTFLKFLEVISRLGFPEIRERFATLLVSDNGNERGEKGSSSSVVGATAADLSGPSLHQTTARSETEDTTAGQSRNVPFAKSHVVASNQPQTPLTPPAEASDGSAVGPDCSFTSTSQPHLPETTPNISKRATMAGNLSTAQLRQQGEDVSMPATLVGNQSAVLLHQQRQYVAQETTKGGQHPSSALHGRPSDTLHSDSIPQAELSLSSASGIPSSPSLPSTTPPQRVTECETESAETPDDTTDDCPPAYLIDLSKEYELVIEKSKQLRYAADGGGCSVSTLSGQEDTGEFHNDENPSSIGEMQVLDDDVHGNAVLEEPSLYSDGSCSSDEDDSDDEYMVSDVDNVTAKPHDEHPPIPVADSPHQQSPPVSTKKHLRRMGQRRQHRHHKALKENTATLQHQSSKKHHLLPSALTSDTEQGSGKKLRATMTYLSSRTTAKSKKGKMSATPSSGRKGSSVAGKRMKGTRYHTSPSTTSEKGVPSDSTLRRRQGKQQSRQKTKDFVFDESSFIQMEGRPPAGQYHLLSTVSGSVYLDKGLLLQDGNIGRANAFLQVDGFDVSKFKVEMFDSGEKFMTTNPHTQAICQRSQQRVFVVVDIAANIDDFYYADVEERLVNVFKRATGCSDIDVVTRRKSGSVMLVLRMDMDAMLLLYDWAIVVPGFLAGLGVLWLRTVGSLDTLDVAPPADKSVSRSGKDPAASLIEGLVDLGLIDTQSLSQSPPSQDALLMQCTRKAFASDSQMEKLITLLEGCFEQQHTPSTTIGVSPAMTDVRCVADDEITSLTGKVSQLQAEMTSVREIVTDHYQSALGQVTELQDEMGKAVHVHQKVLDLNKKLIACLKEMEKNITDNQEERRHLLEELDKLRTMASSNQKVMDHCSNLQQQCSAGRANNATLREELDELKKLLPQHDNNTVDISTPEPGMVKTTTGTSTQSPRSCLELTPAGPEIVAHEYGLRGSMPLAVEEPAVVHGQPINFQQPGAASAGSQLSDLHALSSIVSQLQLACQQWHARAMELERVKFSQDGELLRLRRDQTGQTSTMSQLHASNLSLENINDRLRRNFSATLSHLSTIQASLTRSENTARLLTQRVANLQASLSATEAELSATKSHVTAVEAENSQLNEQVSDNLAALFQESLRVDGATTALQEREEELTSLRTTVAEVTSSNYTHASAARQDMVRNLTTLRHAQTLRNLPRRVSEWKVAGYIPGDIKSCSPALLGDTLYLSMVRGSGNTPCILQNSLMTLERPWGEFPSPKTTSGACLGAVRVFTSSSKLYCSATTDFETVPRTIYEYRDGNWVWLAQLPSVQKDAGYCIDDNNDTLIVAGGVDDRDEPILVIRATSLISGNASWSIVGQLPEYRKFPQFVFDDHHIHIIGGGGYFKDSLTTITTLTRNTHSDMHARYTHSHSTLPKTPFQHTGATAVNGTVVLAGGWNQQQSGSHLGKVVNDVYMFDGQKKVWLPLPQLNKACSQPFLFHFQRQLYCLSGITNDNMSSGATLKHTIEMLEI